MTARGGVILVTGSNGLIGSALAERFSRDYTVVGLDKAGEPPAALTECIELDLTQEDDVRQAVRSVQERYGTRIAAVIHLAAYYDFSGATSPLYEEVTIKGTERLLRSLQDSKFDVEQFIFSSTMLVHAPCEPGQYITEDWPVQPKWAYPESKVQTEELLRNQHGEIPVVIFRIAEVYNEMGHALPISRQIQRIYERQLVSHVFPGDLSHGQTAVHLEDLVAAFALAVQQRPQLPRESVFLIGEAETLSYGELQRAFGQLLHGEEWETREIPKGLAKAGSWIENTIPIGEEPFIKPWQIDIADDHYAYNPGQAKALLGWQSRHSLRATLPAMAANLLKDPLAWYQENHIKPPAWLEEKDHDKSP